MRFDPIAVVEACYAPQGDPAEWLRCIASTLASIAGGWTTYAQAFDAADPARIRFTALASCGPPPIWTELLMPRWEAAPRRLVEIFFAPTPTVDLFSRRAMRVRRDDLGLLRPWRGRKDRTESVALIAADDARRGVCAGFVRPCGYRPPPRLVHTLAMIAAHLRSGVRLCRFVREADERAVASGVESGAVLDPAGRVHDVRGEALDGGERDKLGAAVRMVERARGRLRFADPDEALALWSGLAEGRWSLVDQVEADGRRWVLARRNAPGELDVVALTPREREIAAHAAMGRSNKLIAYSLGLTTSRVSAHLASAERKLRVRSRSGLIAFFRGPLGAEEVRT